MDENKPFTFRSALRAPEYWLIMVAAATPAAGGTWWLVVPLTVAGLSISTLPKYLTLWPRARSAGAQHVWWQTVALSTFNNLAAACGAFLLGVLIRWFWL